MTVLLHPTYFPSISHFVAMIQAQTVVLEMEDNFQKQSNRNRMYIHSPNGIQLLNIPVKHSKIAHQKTKDVRLETAFNWQKQHFKSLEAAYRASPFFEYFEDDLHAIFTKKHVFLMDLNLETLALVCNCLGIAIPFEKTVEYLPENTSVSDFRQLANGKKDLTLVEPYKQVFDEKNGFINNLSILDLLFNEGRHAVDYLKRQKI